MLLATRHKGHLLRRGTLLSSRCCKNMQHIQSQQSIRFASSAPLAQDLKSIAPFINQISAIPPPLYPLHQKDLLSIRDPAYLFDSSSGSHFTDKPTSEEPDKSEKSEKSEKSDKPTRNRKRTPKDQEKTPETPANPDATDKSKVEDKKDKEEVPSNDESSDSKLSIDPNSPTSGSSVGASSGANVSGGGDNDGNNGKNGINGDGKDGNSNDNNNDNSSKDDNSLVVSRTGLYSPLLAIPMRDRPGLPGNHHSIVVRDPEVIKCLKEVVDKREPYFLLFHVRDMNHPESDADIIKNKDFVHNVGTLCQIHKITSMDASSVTVLAYIQNRVKMVDLSTPEVKSKNIEEQKDFATAYLKKFGVSYAAVQPLKDEPYDKNSVEIRALVENFKSLCAELPQSPLATEGGKKLLEFPSMLADFIGGSVTGSPDQIQDIIETLDVKKKLEKTLNLLKTEVEADMIKRQAITNMRERMEKQYAQSMVKEFAKELLKAAGLGENSKAAKFDERVKKLKMPEEALEAYKTEKARLGTLSDTELNTVERYLDWLTSIPFGIYSKDSFNVKKAREILDRDHYGLKDVKDRILEFISVGKVSGTVNGKIICLAGPPGTGKTSIAKSIAEALNRKYTRIAVGGVQDVHDVKGHRRTYVASIPGRIISALVHAKTSNPLMLIDEIDKLDTTAHGGAARAFLEILDPEQNNAFVDNFIEVKVDLSKVLFVCTANYLGSIPPALRDRMEIIEVNGYTKHEKIEIAMRHLIPDACKKAGLKEGLVDIPKETISRLIDKYCRESGLRHVKSLINRIFSKASMKIVEQVEERESDVRIEDVLTEAAEMKKEEKEKKEIVEKEEDKGDNSAEVTSNTSKTQLDLKDDVEKSQENTKKILDKENQVTSANAPIAKDQGKDKEVSDVDAKENKDNDTEVETDTENKSRTESENENENKNENEKNQVEEDEGPVKLALPDDIKVEVTTENLKDFVGPEIYTKDRIYETLNPGVATGLAYNTSGDGDALYIESILTDSISSDLGNNGMDVTGSLKDVMKESAAIAYSFAKQYLVRKFPENRFFEAAHIHVHCPGGAIPKDGPSAGIAFTSSLISLALNKSLPNDTAMTGEITLTGKVLAIGGLREKTLGAKRAGYTKIIYPKDCEYQLEEIPDEVKEGITYIPVEWYHEVFDNLFNVSEEEGNNVWREEFAKREEKKRAKTQQLLDSKV